MSLCDCAVRWAVVSRILNALRVQCAKCGVMELSLVPMTAPSGAQISVEGCVNCISLSFLSAQFLHTCTRCSRLLLVLSRRHWLKSTKESSTVSNHNILSTLARCNVLRHNTRRLCVCPSCHLCSGCTLRIMNQESKRLTETQRKLHLLTSPSFHGCHQPRKRPLAKAVGRHWDSGGGQWTRAGHIDHVWNLGTSNAVMIFPTYLRWPKSSAKE